MAEHLLGALPLQVGHGLHIALQAVYAGNRCLHIIDLTRQIFNRLRLLLEQGIQSRKLLIQ